MATMPDIFGQLAALQAAHDTLVANPPTTALQAAIDTRTVLLLVVQALIFTTEAQLTLAGYGR